MGCNAKDTQCNAKDTFLKILSSSICFSAKILPQGIQNHAFNGLKISGSYQVQAENNGDVKDIFFQRSPYLLFQTPDIFLDQVCLRCPCKTLLNLGP